MASFIFFFCCCLWTGDFNYRTCLSLVHSCPGEDLHNHLDIGLVFIARQLQSSHIDPALSHLLKVPFTRSNFSMAFPYVSPSEDDKTMETSLISGFTETCGHDFGVDNIAFLESCSVDGADFPKLADMQAVHGYLTSVLKNKQNRKKHLIVLCNGGSASSQGLDPSWSEGDIFSEIISSVEQSGASYSVLYASDPYKSLEYTSYRALDRFLAEGSTGNGSVSSSFCDGVCQIKSSFLEGLLVAIVLLIILISGLCCMMGIDTPTRFEAPQDS
ncbi:hypothetical protein IFM89_004510 [Coptis chinensis]|uniref:V-type proton ATPase subunit S1/VOA1 transmembrane domain-containing protein n=1 Tax=Coptis chinensis TaxID=261450 RepID=A0A835LA22_9MAGN|nr:hypothetical protein IFM89_004510 [Coptis chinensis]